jgi:hypothetical protein
MAKKIHHRDGEYIERQSGVDRRHDGGHRSKHMEYTEDSNVSRAAGAVSGDARCAEPVRAVRPQNVQSIRTPFSSASRDVDRAVGCSSTKRIT